MAGGAVAVFNWARVQNLLRAQAQSKDHWACELPSLLPPAIPQPPQRSLEYLLCAKNLFWAHVLIHLNPPSCSLSLLLMTSVVSMQRLRPREVQSLFQGGSPSSGVPEPSV